MKVAITAGIMWLLLTLLLFVLPSFAGKIIIICCEVLFLVVPAANYIGTLFAIRRQNSQLGDAVSSQQTSVVLQREKKVALDMCIIAIFLLASLTPAMFTKILELRYARVHSILLPWSLTLAFFTSSFNPLFYCGRNKQLRKALKSMVKI